STSAAFALMPPKLWPCMWAPLPVSSAQCAVSTATVGALALLPKRSLQACARQRDACSRVIGVRVRGGGSKRPPRAACEAPLALPLGPPLGQVRAASPLVNAPECMTTARSPAHPGFLQNER